MRMFQQFNCTLYYLLTDSFLKCKSILRILSRFILILKAFSVLNTSAIIATSRNEKVTLSMLILITVI